jgi:tRNA(adenine34) deaminase
MKSIEHSDEYFISLALSEAVKAMRNGDVPVGAVIVKDGKVIAKAHNQVEKMGNSIAHAELIAIDRAIKKLKYKNLVGCSIYVTLEPCIMCAGALVLARLDRLIFGATDPKAGACGTLYNIANDDRLNHKINITQGVMSEESSKLLQHFFSDLRIRNKNKI